MVNDHEPTWLDLFDYRQRVAQTYRERAQALHEGAAAADVWQRFRAQKDDLYAHHPQSPLAAEDRQAFTGLRYFPYDPALCVVATLEVAEDDAPQTLEASGPHTMRFRRAARVRFTLGDTPLELLIYWIDVYGGGLLLPFRDATGGSETYGGGRYLCDTVKGSDLIRRDADASLGYAGGAVLLDFNYAYNPSCAYDARWICPLAPPENRLALPIRAGELLFHPERSLP